jgi:hypothetical protein
LNHPKVVNTALSQARGVSFLVVVWGTMCTYLSNRPGLQRLEFLVKKGLSDAGRTRISCTATIATLCMKRVHRRDKGSVPACWSRLHRGQEAACCVACNAAAGCAAAPIRDGAATATARACQSSVPSLYGCIMACTDRRGARNALQALSTAAAERLAQAAGKPGWPIPTAHRPPAPDSWPNRLTRSGRGSLPSRRSTTHSQHLPCSPRCRNPCKLLACKGARPGVHASELVPADDLALGA